MVKYTHYNGKPLYDYSSKRYKVYVPEVDKYVFVQQLRLFNLTPQQWYDKYVLHIDNENDRPKCVICGKPVHFDRPSRGYVLTCSDECYKQRHHQNSTALWLNWDDSKRAQVSANRSIGIKRYIENLTPEEHYQQFHIKNSLGQQRPETKLKRSNSLKQWWSQIDDITRQNLPQLRGLRHPESHKKSAQSRLQHRLDDINVTIDDIDKVYSRGSKTRLYLGKDILFATNNREWLTVQSNYELQLVQLLETLQIHYQYSPCIIKYWSSNLNRHRTYIVDFAIYFKTYTIYVEIKPWFRRNDIDVIDKFNAFQASIQDKSNTIYTMMYEGEIQQGEQHLLEVLNQLIDGSWMPAKPGEVLND